VKDKSFIFDKRNNYY